MKINLTCKAEADELIRELKELDFNSSSYSGELVKDEKQRTPTQNKSMHLWHTMASNALNDAGMDIRKTLKEDFELPWTGPAFKEYVWKPIQLVTQQFSSTTEANTTQYNEIYKIICREMSARHGINLPPWPNRRG